MEPPHPTKFATTARYFISALLSRQPIEYGKFGWDEVKALLQALLVSGPATRRDSIASRYAESTLVPEAGLIASRHISHSFGVVHLLLYCHGLQLRRHSIGGAHPRARGVQARCTEEGARRRKEGGRGEACSTR